jgi:hypothetical protein
MEQERVNIEDLKFILVKNTGIASMLEKLG